MRRLIASSLLLSVLFVPVSGFALEGIGPRVTIVGTVVEVHISKDQAFNEYGGEFVIRATNNQLVTVVLDRQSIIITEGQSSRRQLKPTDVVVNMQVRVRGWRVDSETLTGSLFIITNISNNPILTLSGVLQSVDANSISVLLDNGEVRKFTVTNETEVNLSYTIWGMQGLILTNKQVLLTLNPSDRSQVKIIRITGDKTILRTKPSTIELRRR